MDGIHFLVDGDGSRTAVVIDLDMYGDLIEDLLDAAVARERESEDDVPWEAVRAEILNDLRAGGPADAVPDSDEVVRSS